MSDTSCLPRRSFLGATAIGIVATRFTAGTALAQAADLPSTQQASPLKRLQPLKHIDAGVLEIEYFEIGPANGSPVILLRGWPYDIHTYADVAPLLAEAGRRVSQQAGKTPWPPQAEAQWWYQYYFATERGRLGYEKKSRTQRLREEVLGAVRAPAGQRRHRAQPAPGGTRSLRGRRARCDSLLKLSIQSRSRQ